MLIFASVGRRVIQGIKTKARRSACPWVLIIIAGQIFLGGCGAKAAETRFYRSIYKVAISAEDRERALREIYARVAGKYFPLVTTIQMHDRAALKRSARAEIGLRSGQISNRVTGVVVDRRNVTVPGATVLVTDETEQDIIGRAVTDDHGRFSAELFSASYNSLTLHVIAKGYAKWFCERIFGGIQDWPVQLDQNVDGRFMDTLAAAQNPETKIWMLLEIIGARRSPVMIEEVFPYIGDLRGELLRVASMKEFNQKDDEVSSPAERAVDLLAYWREPEDIAWLKENLPKKTYTLFKKTAISGNSPTEVCRTWAAAFLAQAEVEPRPPSSCGKPRYTSDKRRAVIELTIFEPYSTYSHMLSMLDNGKGWELMLVKYGR